MQKLFYILILFLFVISCSYQKHLLGSAKPVTFIPDSSLFEKNKNWIDLPTLNFEYFDRLGITTGTFSLNKNRETNLFIHSPSYVFPSKNLNVPYLIYPGEKVIVRLSEDGSFDFIIAGNNKRNNEFSFNKSYSIVMRPLTFINFLTDENISIDSVLIIEKKLKEEIIINRKIKLRLLDSIASLSNINEKEKNVAADALLVQENFPLTFLYKEHADTLLAHNLYQEKTKQLINVFDSLANPDVMSFEQVSFEAYNLFAMLISPVHYAPGINSIIDFEKYFSIVENNFTGTVKNYLLTRIVYETALKNIPLPQEYIEKYNTFCDDDNYKKSISDIIKADKTKYNTSNQLLNFKGKKIKSIEEIFLKYRGKPVFVDFWASWCQPCRRQLPFSNALEKAYGNNINFIYVSLDKDQLDWRKAVLTENLDKDKNYLFNNCQENSFLLDHKIESIPQYILINKYGEIVNDNLPRPGDLNNLKKIIDKLVK